MSQVTALAVNAAPAPMTPLRSSGTILNAIKARSSGWRMFSVILDRCCQLCCAVANPAEQFRDAAGAAGLAGRRQLAYSGERMMLVAMSFAPDVWRAFVTAGRLSAVVLSLVMGILARSRATSAVRSITSLACGRWLCWPRRAWQLLALVLVAIFGLPSATLRWR